MGRVLRVASLWVAGVSLGDDRIEYLKLLAPSCPLERDGRGGCAWWWC